jgi:hypothetical protein
MEEGSHPKARDYSCIEHCYYTKQNYTKNVVAVPLIADVLGAGCSACFCCSAEHNIFLIKPSRPVADSHVTVLIACYLGP